MRGTDKTEFPTNGRQVSYHVTQIANERIPLTWVWIAGWRRSWRGPVAAGQAAGAAVAGGHPVNNSE